MICECRIIPTRFGVSHQEKFLHSDSYHPMELERLVLVRESTPPLGQGQGPLGSLLHEGRCHIFRLMKIAAIVGVTLLAVVVVFQIALAVGAPLGKAAWGGRHEGVLPKRLRIASGFAALLVYPLIILVVLDSASLIDMTFLPGNGEAVMWVLCGLFSLGGLANVASRSTVERYWAPISVAIAVCCAIVASAL